MNELKPQKPAKQEPITQVLRVVATKSDLVDPYNTAIRYPKGKPVVVETVHTWLQMQIDAGLMTKL